MKEQYHLLTKQDPGNFPFQQSPKPIVPVEPDLLLEMTFLQSYLSSVILHQK